MNSPVIPLAVEKITNGLNFEPYKGGLVLPKIVDPLLKKELKEVKLDSLEWEHNDNHKRRS